MGHLSLLNSDLQVFFFVVVCLFCPALTVLLFYRGDRFSHHHGNIDDRPRYGLFVCLFVDDQAVTGVNLKCVKMVAKRIRMKQKTKSLHVVRQFVWFILYVFQLQCRASSKVQAGRYKGCLLSFN